MWLLTNCKSYDVAEFYLIELKKEDLLSIVVLKQALKRVNALSSSTSHLTFTPAVSYVFSEYYGPVADSSTSYGTIQMALADLMEKNKTHKDFQFCFITNEEAEAIKSLVGNVWTDTDVKVSIGTDSIYTYLAYDGGVDIEDVYAGDTDFVSFELSEQLILDSL